MTDIRDAFSQVRSYLNQEVLEREDEIIAVLAAVVAGEHVFMIGPPGVAKSYLIRKMVECFDDDVKYFEKLISATTNYSEIYGPPSVSALKQDRFEYKYQGYLPDADFAFLDEIFKGNSSLNNSHLTAMNERLFHNGTNTLNIPLNTLFAASNELPQDDSLKALYDRFLVRLEAKPLLKGASRLELLNRIDGGYSNDAPKVLTKDIIRQAREESAKVKVSDEVKRKFLGLKHKIETQMNETVYVSDRRWLKVYELLKRIVWVMGQDEVTSDDFIYLKDLLWEKPSQQSALASMLRKEMSPVTNKSKELYDKIESDFRALEEGKVDGGELGNMYNRAKGWRAELDKLAAEGQTGAIFAKYDQKFDDLFKTIQKRFADFMGIDPSAIG